MHAATPSGVTAGVHAGADNYCQSLIIASRFKSYQALILHNAPCGQASCVHHGMGARSAPAAKVAHMQCAHHERMV